MVLQSNNKTYLIVIAVSVVALFLFTIVVMIFSPDSFNRQCAIRHNFYRHKHRSPSVSISKRVVENAQKRAEELKNTDKFEHRKDNEFGENLYLSSVTPPQPNALDALECEKAIELWYKEYKDYNFKTGKSKNGKMVGHFTQVVWTDTLEIGCAKSYSEKSNKVYLVCNYDPHGNIISKFREKVPDPV